LIDWNTYLYSLIVRALRIKTIQIIIARLIRSRLKNNTKILKVLELLTKKNSSSNKNFEIRETLNDDEIELNMFFINKKYLLVALFSILF